ncbi:hypothetical protein [Nocardia rhizosphaerae]|uniref:Helicase XPB/Ssl2 N-terminal domain-containing protein n=1 Tax=Nocardia rhizosphaerae TaxID=1691571 RepID=A0ABV8LAA1_9NOCA
MRMRFELEETNEYAVARALFVRRCNTWARGDAVEAERLGSVLDARHASADGRLNFWSVAGARRVIVEEVLRTPECDPAGRQRIGDSVRTLIRYQAKHGLLDPRGDDLARLDAAVADAVAEDPAVGQADAAADVMDVLARWLGDDGFAERTFAQLPVELPADAELAARAADSEIVRRIRQLTEWVGCDGRKLTARGALRLADARELVTLLETGDEVAGVRTSADLPGLSLLVGWARKARVVRVVKGELRVVAKARPLLADPLALWNRLFEAYFDLDSELFPGMSPFRGMCEDVSADVLASLYSLPHPMPVVRLEVPVWLGWQDGVWFEEHADAEFYRGLCADALGRMLDVLVRLGAIERSTGVPHPEYSADLVPGVGPTESEFDDLECADLITSVGRERRLVRLTDLGRAAMRRRMLAEGREAGLIGELAEAEPAALLGVLADHYHPEAAEAEIAGWLAGHENDIEPLLTAIHHCPFRSRSAAMLRVLVEALPHGDSVLGELRHHRLLAPLAITLLIEDESLTHAELGFDEGMRAMTEGFLLLLEVAGPDEVRAQLGQLPREEREGLVSTIEAAGHPATVAVADLLEVMTTSAGRRLRMV